MILHLTLAVPSQVSAKSGDKVDDAFLCVVSAAAKLVKEEEPIIPATIDLWRAGASCTSLRSATERLHAYVLATGAMVHHGCTAGKRVDCQLQVRHVHLACVVSSRSAPERTWSRSESSEFFDKYA